MPCKIRRWLVTHWSPSIVLCHIIDKHPEQKLNLRTFTESGRAKLIAWKFQVMGQTWVAFQAENVIHKYLFHTRTSSFKLFPSSTSQSSKSSWKKKDAHQRRDTFHHGSEVNDSQNIKFCNPWSRGIVIQYSILQGITLGKLRSCIETDILIVLRL